MTAVSPTATDGRTAARIDARVVMSTIRTLVGVASWVDPPRAGRAFGLGPVNDDPAAAFVGRLFGVRDLALGQAIRHRDPALRRAALQIGVAVDTVDVVASLLARRRGAPWFGVLFGGGGAACFVGLGLLALRDLGPDSAIEPAQLPNS